MPRSIEEYQALAEAIPKLGSSLTGLVQQGLTYKAAGSVADQQTLKGGLAEMSRATPFPGAVDEQSPVMQNALRQTMMAEDERKEADNKAMMRSVLKGGNKVAKQWGDEIARVTNGGFVPPDPSNIQSEDQRESWYKYNSMGLLNWFKSQTVEEKEKGKLKRHLTPKAGTTKTRPLSVFSKIVGILDAMGKQKSWSKFNKADVDKWNDNISQLEEEGWLTATDIKYKKLKWYDRTWPRSNLVEVVGGGEPMPSGKLTTNLPDFKMTVTK